MPVFYLIAGGLCVIGLVVLAFVRSNDLIKNLPFLIDDHRAMHGNDPHPH